MAIVGYARVSTEGQNLSAQLAALKAAGATTIYREKVSGVRANRPQLAKLMAGLGTGDVVVVTKLDRLGRSTRELLDLIDRISKAGASFRSLGDPLWDTGSSQGRLLPIILVINKPLPAVGHVKQWAGHSAKVWGAGMPQPVVPKHARAFPHDWLFTTLVFEGG